MGFGVMVKTFTFSLRRHRRVRFDSWLGKIPWRRAWQPTPVFLPGESCGQRSLVGYSPWGCKQPDMTEAIEHGTAQPQVAAKDLKCS